MFIYGMDAVSYVLYLPVLKLATTRHSEYGDDGIVHSNARHGDIIWYYKQGEFY